MKTVITTVGTSLFTNYLKVNNNIKNHYEKLEEKTLSGNDRNEWKIEIKFIKDNVLAYAKRERNSAELKSLEKLFLVLNEKDLDLIFICSDSILSELAAQIVTEVIKTDVKYKEFLNNEPKIISINNLVPYKNDFVKEGLTGLISNLENICMGYYSNKILNITGGFKGVIPYLTIWGQINKVPLYYIFEDSEVLLRIPQSPITINYNIFEKYYDIFLELSKGLELSKEEYINKKNIKSDFPIDLIYEICDKEKCLLSLDPLGLIYWKHFTSKFFIFYAPKEILEEIEKQPDIKRIISEKFWKKEIRENKTEIKGNHYVYDDGDNPNRIYYFDVQGKIYIYKTFQDEELAKQYINKSISKEDIIKKSVQKTIEVNNYV